MSSQRVLSRNDCSTKLQVTEHTSLPGSIVSWCVCLCMSVCLKWQDRIPNKLLNPVVFLVSKLPCSCHSSDGLDMSWECPRHTHPQAGLQSSADSWRRKVTIPWSAQAVLGIARTGAELEDLWNTTNRAQQSCLRFPAGSVSTTTENPTDEEEIHGLPRLTPCLCLGSVL